MFCFHDFVTKKPKANKYKSYFFFKRYALVCGVYLCFQHSLVDYGLLPFLEYSFLSRARITVVTKQLFECGQKSEKKI